MRKIIEYTIVTFSRKICDANACVDFFKTEVNSLIRQGWELYGDSVTAGGKTYLMYSQAMVKYEEETK